MSLVETRLQNWRMELPDFDKNESRPCEYGALDFFVRESEDNNALLTPEFRRRAFESIGNTLEIPVIDTDGEVTVASTRTCTIADDENTSKLYTVVWQTLQVGFTMVPAAYRNNEIGYQRDFNRKMEKVCRALANKLDVKAVATLEANKTQILKDGLNYNFGGHVIDCPKEMAGDLFGDINSMMRANCYPGKLHIVGNTGIDSLIRKLAQHGVYNDVNKQNEFEGKVFHYSTNVTNALSKNGTFYAVESGNVGVITRVDREAAAGTKSKTGHEWGVVTLPYIDLPVGYHYYESVGDQSNIMGAATQDLVCGVKQYFGYSLDVAFLVAYNSDLSTKANPIIKGQIVARDKNEPYATPVYMVNPAPGA